MWSALYAQKSGIQKSHEVDRAKKPNRLYPSHILSKRADQLYKSGLFDLLMEIIRTNHWFWTSKSILIVESAASRWSRTTLWVKSDLLCSTFLPAVSCHILTWAGCCMHLSWAQLKLPETSLHTATIALEQTPFPFLHQNFPAPLPC